MQLFEQHCAFAVQDCPVVRQLIAFAALGAIILVTRGNATAAPTPIRRITSRRDITVPFDALLIGSSSSRAFSN
jgi:hypothetical protein